MRALVIAVLVCAGCDRRPPATLVPTGTTDSAPAPDSGTLGVGTGHTGLPEEYTMIGFSFIDAHVAGLPQPGARVPLEQDLAFLVDQGITLLASLTETPTDPVAVDAAGLRLLHLPIVDFTPPTLDQQVALVDAIRAEIALAGRVGVHDTAGLGRCGTMLATWFVAGGMGPDEAIAEVRALRPGSIETVEQEAAVHAYAAHLTAR